MKFAAQIFSLAFLASCVPALVPAQAPAANYQSTEIHPDRTITFRFKDPGATKVLLNIRDLPKPMPMQKDGAGIWTVTTEPLPPAIYNYYFDADGQWRIDPANPHVAIKQQNVTNLLTVTGGGPQPWEDANVPHGDLHHHFYTSSVVLNLPNHQDDYYVYTPPGYDPKSATPYPVLYLLHGFNEAAYTWTAVGHANFILDNLLAAGKIKPMVVVMPLGYGDLNYVLDSKAHNDPTITADHYHRFEQALLTEVLPQIESTYNVARDRDHRAIAGLSMGGHESLTVGLANTSKFAYVIGLSAAAQGVDQDPRLANLDPKAANLRLLWDSVGTSDSLLEPNRKFVAWLKSKDMAVTAVETPGNHGWIVWQDNLVHFAPLLFQSK